MLRQEDHLEEHTEDGEVHLYTCSLANCLEEPESRRFLSLFHLSILHGPGVACLILLPVRPPALLQLRAEVMVKFRAQCGHIHRLHLLRRRAKVTKANGHVHHASQVLCALQLEMLVMIVPGGARITATARLVRGDFAILEILETDEHDACQHEAQPQAFAPGPSQLWQIFPGRKSEGGQAHRRQQLRHCRKEGSDESGCFHRKDAVHVPYHCQRHSDHNQRGIIVQLTRKTFISTIVPGVTAEGQHQQRDATKAGEDGLEVCPALCENRKLGGKALRVLVEKAHQAHPDPSCNHEHQTGQQLGEKDRPCQVRGPAQVLRVAQQNGTHHD
mmetsp:Transcript_8008/g.18639  ORF Transcript_8008/g.18639 Transcript_8008/m.18639 type:complete len:330 (-) Transcript_8008:969-1958(-)